MVCMSVPGGGCGKVFAVFHGQPKLVRGEPFPVACTPAASKELPSPELAHCCYKHTCRVGGGPAPAAFACCDHTLSMRSDPNFQPVGGPHAGTSPAGNCHLGPGPYKHSSHKHVHVPAQSLTKNFHPE